MKLIAYNSQYPSKEMVDTIGEILLITRKDDSGLSIRIVGTDASWTFRSNIVKWFTIDEQEFLITPDGYLKEIVK